MHGFDVKKTAAEDAQKKVWPSNGCVNTSVSSLLECPNSTSSLSAPIEVVHGYHRRRLRQCLANFHQEVATEIGNEQEARGSLRWKQLQASAPWHNGNGKTSEIADEQNVNQADDAHDGVEIHPAV